MWGGLWEWLDDSEWGGWGAAQVSVSSSWRLASEDASEKYKDLRALLQLLTNLSSKDMVGSHCTLPLEPCRLHRWKGMGQE